MPNNNYTIGRQLEYAVQDKLEKRGFYCIRSAGSHTVVDITALDKDRVLLIQCKSSSIEEIPQVKQLLGGENVKLLEEMNYTFPHVKYIVWKGKGRNNYWTFRYFYPTNNTNNWTQSEWVAQKGFNI